MQWRRAFHRINAIDFAVQIGLVVIGAIVVAVWRLVAR
jgi:hypothetical protein